LADVACTLKGLDSIKTFLSDGEGGLVPTWTGPAGLQPNDIAVADLDGDGVGDLVIPYGGGGTAGGLTVLRGLSDGRFAAQQTVPLLGMPRCAATGDFNEDGMVDVVVGTMMQGWIDVLLNQGAGALFKTSDYFVGEIVPDIVVGDFDEDGHLDVVAGELGGLNRLFRGSGAGTFSRTTLAIGQTSGLAVGDFDADSHMDLANTQGGYFNTVRSWRGAGDGTFKLVSTTTVNCCPTALDLVDLDGNGTPDLIATTGEVSSILFNDGAGVFTNEGTLAQPDAPVTSVGCDLDGDGVREVITACGFGDSLTVYRRGATVSVPPIATLVQMRVAPSPTRAYTRLVISGLESDALVAIYDVSGRLMERRMTTAAESGRGVRIPRTGVLAAGLYFVRARSGSWTGSTRVVVLP